MKRIKRLDAVRCRVECGRGVEALLFASEAVEIDPASLADLASFAELKDTVARLGETGFFGDADAALARIVLTPDFHRGSSMPVGTVAETRGFVLPRAAGNDIGCGMSLAVLDLEAAEIAALGRPLDDALRHAFFEGGRDIRLDAAMRAQVLVEGPGALADASPAGLWSRLGPDGVRETVRRIHGGGRIGGARATEALSEWISPGGRAGPTRDSFAGSIGGGNHFVEIQRVEAILDRRAAWAWGLGEGGAAVMVHAGSLGLGRAVALRHLERAKDLWPRILPRPENGFLPLPLAGPHAGTGRLYLADMAAAANFATLNRLALSLMVAECLERVLERPVGWRLVHDLPHNLVWADAETALHRKGACPAVCDPFDPLFPTGCPVVVPGSMGTASWLLRGLGSAESLASAPHGAGRALRRNESRRRGMQAGLRIVTRVDLARTRRDVAREAGRTLAEEAPTAYKDVEPVADTVCAAGIAEKVARLAPILTVKG